MMMKLVAEFAPGEPGARGLTARYGEGLRKVRVYVDAMLQRRVTTVELQVDECDVTEPTRAALPPTPSSVLPPPQLLDKNSLVSAQGEQHVFLQLPNASALVVQALEDAGAHFHENSQSWVVLRTTAVSLGLLTPGAFAWVHDTLPEPLPVGLPKHKAGKACNTERLK